jgi:hypothetical protein
MEIQDDAALAHPHPNHHHDHREEEDLPRGDNEEEAPTFHGPGVWVHQEEKDEEDGEDDHYNGEETKAKLPLVVDDRMRISPQGRAWASAIKAAIEADPEIDNLNDFCYVQLAVICLENVEEAVEKARDMQGFRNEYNVRDDLEDAKKTVWEYLNLYDNFILSFTYSEDEKSYVLAVDFAAMDYKAVQTDKAWRTNIAGIYYIKQAMVPDFLSMCNGITILHECDGFDFYGKFGGLNHISRLSKELFGAQPVLHRNVKWFNAGT